MTFFFVLSGFVMAWAHRFEVGQNYFKKRFLRIYPAYLFMGFLTIPFLNGFDLGKLASVLGLFFTGTQSWYSQSFSVWNFSGSWSVSTEIFFYVMFPFIYNVVKKYPVPALLLSYLAASAIIPISISLNGMDMMPAYYISPIHRIPEFIFGMSVGFLFFKGIEISNWLIALVLISLSSYVLGTFATIDNNSYMLNNYMTVPATGMIILSMASMKIKRSILTRPFIYLGEISYSFYLMYLPLAMFVKANKDLFASFSNFESWIILFLLNLFMAIISYEMIEKRFAFSSKKKQSAAVEGLLR